MEEAPKIVSAPALVVAPGPGPATVPAPQPGMQEDKLPSTTTAEEDRVTAGQRDTSMMWETNQKWIALIVIGVSVVVAGVVVVFGYRIGATDLQLASAMFLNGAANLVIGFYFGRTNHTRVGGVGASESKFR